MRVTDELLIQLVGGPAEAVWWTLQMGWIEARWLVREGEGLKRVATSRVAVSNGNLVLERLEYLAEHLEGETPWEQLVLRIKWGGRVENILVEMVRGNDRPDDPVTVKLSRQAPPHETLPPECR